MAASVQAYKKPRTSEREVTTSSISLSSLPATLRGHTITFLDAIEAMCSVRCVSRSWRDVFSSHHYAPPSLICHSRNFTHANFTRAPLSQFNHVRSIIAFNVIDFFRSLAAPRTSLKNLVCIDSRRQLDFHAGCVLINSCTNLSILHLHGDLTDDDLRSLRSLQGLTSITLKTFFDSPMRASHLTPAGINELTTHCADLHTLDLSYCFELVTIERLVIIFQSLLIHNQKLEKLFVASRSINKSKFSAIEGGLKGRFSHLTSSNLLWMIDCTRTNFSKLIELFPKLFFNIEIFPDYFHGIDHFDCIQDRVWSIKVSNGQTKTMLDVPFTALLSRFPFSCLRSLDFSLSRAIPENILPSSTLLHSQVDSLDFSASQTVVSGQLSSLHISLPSLRSLDLSRRTDAIDRIGNISAHPSLTFIDCSNCFLSESRVAELMPTLRIKFPKLKTVRIKESPPDLSSFL